MRAVWLLSVLVLLSVGGLVTCLRIRDFRIPLHVAEGEDAVLGCKFDLDKQQLYAIRWFKDDQEFYGYKPSGNSPHAFKGHGVSVDLSRSGLTSVTLVHMNRESEGEYRCEITGEGPGFEQVSAKGRISVHLLPESEPQVTGLREFYRVNEPLELNCSSLGSRPTSQIQWLVNGYPAPVYHVRGPWYTRSVHRIDATDTTLELSFGVLSGHFPRGVMTITCRATVPPLYHKEAVFRYQMLPRAKQGKLIETTTEHYFKTTKEPSTSTIKIPIEEPSKHLEPWSLTSQTPDSAGYLDSSAVALLLCISIGALF